jgi:predicted Fe-S protein YdhL (DUF1289 family)
VNSGSSDQAQPASPCVGVCRLDAHSVCVGCGRRIEEIAAWGHADRESRLRIIEAACRRLRLLQGTGVRKVEDR